MLSETALCIANKIAQRLAEKNLQVIPRSGSPVEAASAGRSGGNGPGPRLGAFGRRLKGLVGQGVRHAAMEDVGP